MRLQQLGFFVEVSRCRSFSLAASRLFMTQQNVSAGIRKLETELGYDLFERTHQGVVLTPQGKQALIIAEEILSKVGELKFVDHPTKKQLSGELRVEMVPYIALPEMIIDFYRHNPGASVKTNDKSPAEIIADVESGFADIGFIYLREGEHIKTEGLAKEYLSLDQLYLCVSKRLGYPKQSLSANGFFEKDLPLIVFNGLYDWAMEMLEALSEQKPLVYRADIQLYKRMILEGLAAGFATKTGIDHEIVFKKGEVDTLKIDRVYLVVCMLYKKDPTSPLKEGFLNMVRDKFSVMNQQVGS